MDAGVNDVFADQVFLLARRSVVRTIRQPANVIAPLIFPMMLLAVNSGGLKAETRLPGFPTDSIVAFLLAVPFIQGALFATMNAGTDLARDIQTGFLNRLSLTPMRGVGAARRPARRRRDARARPGGVLPRASGSQSASASPPGVPGVLVLLRVRASRRARLRRARDLRRRSGPARARRCRASSRCSSSSSSSRRWRFRAT